MTTTSITNYWQWRQQIRYFGFLRFAWISRTLFEVFRIVCWTFRRFRLFQMHLDALACLCMILEKAIGFLLKMLNRKVHLLIHRLSFWMFLLFDEFIHSHLLGCSFFVCWVAGDPEEFAMVAEPWHTKFEELHRNHIFQFDGISFKAIDIVVFILYCPWRLVRRHWPGNFLALERSINSW